jgi:hypothetical protein
LGSFIKIIEVPSDTFWANFSKYMLCTNLTKNWLGYVRGDFLRTHLVNLSPRNANQESLKRLKRLLTGAVTVTLLACMSSQLNTTALPKKTHTLEGLDLGSAAFGAAGMPLRLAVRVLKASFGHGGLVQWSTQMQTNRTMVALNPSGI